MPGFALPSPPLVRVALLSPGKRGTLRPLSPRICQEGNV
jgi:hypothetical protein